MHHANQVEPTLAEQGPVTQLADATAGLAAIAAGVVEASEVAGQAVAIKNSEGAFQEIFQEKQFVLNSN